ncbi:MAG: 4-hydroxy-tetrahydrodipicolinate synthase [Deltaproteobacteria bacterium]|nr:MAG: 4-hydroxy-tetrahydrodipicolinate synthase [Deltaproteobacteria bacterium]
MLSGCFTALITPFKNDAVDEEGLSQLVTFQIDNGIDGILAVGTTGESPVLHWEEHNLVTEKVAAATKDKCICIAGTGSNNTAEALEGSRHAVAAGVQALLLVDPYYNGPSSLEIRREYVAPIAAAFPDTQIIPYVIPGRTGAQLLPEDLALLSRKYPNVGTVKEATGDLANMRHTRKCCGPDFTILSGDDGLTFEMMSTPDIGAAGVISVATNIAPKAVSQMVAHLAAGETDAATQLNTALAPLFSLVTVKTTEKTAYGDVVCRARNPLALKTLMSILGMPSGGCRQPLGKMTRNGLNTVLAAARKIQTDHPEIFQPAADFFNVDIPARLANPASWEGLSYKDYA